MPSASVSRRGIRIGPAFLPTNCASCGVRAIVMPCRSRIETMEPAHNCSRCTMSANASRVGLSVRLYRTLPSGRRTGTSSAMIGRSTTLMNKSETDGCPVAKRRRNDVLSRRAGSGAPAGSAVFITCWPSSRRSTMLAPGSCCLSTASARARKAAMSPVCSACDVASTWRVPRRPSRSRCTSRARLRVMFSARRPASARSAW